MNFAIGNIPGGVILFAYALFKVFWYCWMRNAFAFVAVVLRTAAIALRENAAPFFFGCALFIWKGFWAIIMVGAYYKLHNSPTGEVFLVLGYFWSMQVITNVLAVTIAGSVASWYFYTGMKTPPSRTPTLNAFLRALSWSFGSIAFGSLIVALLATAAYFLKKSKNMSNKCLKAMILCCLACLEKAVETFNTYAFVQVATHGSTYCESARETIGLLRRSGLMVVLAVCIFISLVFR
jgi:hypothetical protein